MRLQNSTTDLPCYSHTADRACPGLHDNHMQWCGHMGTLVCLYERNVQMSVAASNYGGHNLPCIVSDGCSCVEELGLTMELAACLSQCKSASGCCTEDWFKT